MRWAHFRFAIIGELLASPPAHGELAARLSELAERPYRHPTTGVHVSVPSIERWYYTARNHPADPVAALGRKIDPRAGSHPSIGLALGEAIIAQHREHPSWSYQLHHDNLLALAATHPQLGPVPSYAAVRRYMKDRALYP